MPPPSLARSVLKPCASKPFAPNYDSPLLTTAPQRWLIWREEPTHPSMLIKVILILLRGINIALMCDDPENIVYRNLPRGINMALDL